MTNQKAFFCEFNLSTPIDAVVDFFKKVPLPTTFGVPDGGGVGRLGDEKVWPALVDPCGPQMSVRGHVVVSSVDQALLPDSDVKHGCAEHVTSIVGFDLHLVVYANHLSEFQNEDSFHTSKKRPSI